MKPERPVVDEDEEEQEAEQAKELWCGAQVYRDQFVLQKLREEGFCFGSLGADSDPDTDFLIFLDALGGCPNLVVSAPEHSLAQLRTFYAELPHWEFEDGKIEVIERFCPDPETWFRFDTEIVFWRDGEIVPADLRPDDSEPRWAHCACVETIKAGARSRLWVIHVNLDRDTVFADLLAPQALVPRRLIYEW